MTPAAANALCLGHGKTHSARCPEDTGCRPCCHQPDKQDNGGQGGSPDLDRQEGSVKNRRCGQARATEGQDSNAEQAGRAPRA